MGVQRRDSRLGVIREIFIEEAGLGKNPKAGGREDNEAMWKMWGWVFC